MPEPGCASALIPMKQHTTNRISNLIFLLEQLRQISRAMQDANDFNPILHRAIEDNIATQRQTSESRRQFFALASEVWHGREHREFGNESVNEFVRRIRVVLCDVNQISSRSDLAASEIRNWLMISVACETLPKAFCQTGQLLRPTASR